MPKDEPKQLDLPSEGLQKTQFSNLGNVVQTSLLDNSPDEFTKESLDDFELQRKRQDYNHRQDEHDQRIDFAKKIYWLSCGWLSVVIIVLVASGIKCLAFELDNSGVCSPTKSGLVAKVAALAALSSFRASDRRSL